MREVTPPSFYVYGAAELEEASPAGFGRAWARFVEGSYGRQEHAGAWRRALALRLKELLGPDAFDPQGWGGQRPEVFAEEVRFTAWPRRVDFALKRVYLGVAAKASGADLSTLSEAFPGTEIGAALRFRVANDGDAYLPEVVLGSGQRMLLQPLRELKEARPDLLNDTAAAIYLGLRWQLVERLRELEMKFESHERFIQISEANGLEYRLDGEPWFD